MKTYNQFVTEAYSSRENLQELVPLLAAPAVAGALKLGSAALAAYSAYSAAKNLKKGNYGQAAWDAVGVVPGGKVFQGIKALGGAKRLAQAGSVGQSLVRNFGPTARNKVLDKATDKAINAVTGTPAQAKQSSGTQQTGGTQPAVGTQSTGSTQPAAPKPTTVLARKGGVMGKLDKSTGKFTSGDWTKQESDRYKRVAGAKK